MKINTGISTWTRVNTLSHSISSLKNISHILMWVGREWSVVGLSAGGNFSESSSTSSNSNALG